MCCKAGPHTLFSIRQDTVPKVTTMLVGRNHHKSRSSAHRGGGIAAHNLFAAVYAAFC